MNHLDKAKKHARKGYHEYDNGNEGYSGYEAQQAQAHALIAIAEQLEKMNGGEQTDTHAVKRGLIDIFDLCETIPDGCEDAQALDELVTRIHSKADETLGEFIEEDK